MSSSQYLVALGSNQRHVRHGGPKNILNCAIDELGGCGIDVCARSKNIQTHPIGPSRRKFANAAIIVETTDQPTALLQKLKEIERQFGLRRGQKWSRRVLDLDIILWSEGTYANSQPALTIPHPAMRERTFVLEPLAEIAPHWRDPITGLTIRQLLSRQKRAKPLDPLTKPH